jgi:hypothetical protein
MHWLLALALATAPSPELLKKLAEHDARTDDADKAGAVTMTSTSEELDSDGKVVHTRVRVIRTGKTDELISATDDGKDVTAEKKKKFEERAREHKEELKLDSPFAGKVQDKYVFGDLGPDKADPSLTRISFAPKEGKSEEVAIGEATVDAATGEPVRFQLRPSELPRFADHVLVRIELGAKSGVGRRVSKVSVEGDGGLLFIKKRFRATTVYAYGP